MPGNRRCHGGIKQSAESGVNRGTPYRFPPEAVWGMSMASPDYRGRQAAVAADHRMAWDPTLRRSTSSPSHSKVTRMARLARKYQIPLVLGGNFLVPRLG